MTAKETKKKQEIEQSVELRIVSFVMTGICLASFCYYADAPFVITIAYVTAAALGSYLSYLFRKRKSVLVTWLTIFGTCGVLGSFIGEAIRQFYGAGQFMIPFMRVLCGLLVLHTFDLRTRGDLYICSVIGLGLLGCVASQADKNATFGVFPLSFIIAGSFYLYLLSLSHSQDGEPAVVTDSHRPPGSLFGQPRVTARRSSTGSTFGVLTTLPFAAVLLFCMLPRTGTSIVDVIADNARSLIIKIEHYLNPPKPPPSTAYAPPQKVSLPPFQRPSDTGPKRPEMAPPKQDKNGEKGQGKGQGTTPETNRPFKQEQLSGYTKPNPNAPNKGGSAEGSTGDSTGKGKGSEGQKGKNGKARPREENYVPQLLLGRLPASAGTEEPLDSILLTVKANRPAYLRCAAFDNYANDRWNYSNDQQFFPWKKIGPNGYNLVPFPSFRLPVSFQGSELEARIEIRSTLAPYVPTGWIPQSVFFPHQIKVGNDGSIVTDKPLAAGLFYTSVALVPGANLTQMRSARQPEGRDMEGILKQARRYLTLPKDFSPQSRALALTAAGRDGNWFVKAERIADFLRKNYRYTADKPELSPAQDSTYEFLFNTKKGACGQFASAQVLLCRAAGIPARCVVGYSPGDKDKVLDQFLVRKKHEHAWAEVFSPVHGWVPIDATPQGMLPIQPQQDVSGGRTVIRSTRMVDPEKEVAKAEQGQKSWAWARKFQNPYVLAILIAVLLFVVIDAARRIVAWQKAKREKMLDLAGKRLSTQMYLKLLRDLEKLEIPRQKSDTPEDISTRVHRFVEDRPSIPYAMKAELPVLVDSFIEEYYLERFAKEDEKAEEYNKLGEIGDKIHALVLQSTLTSSSRN